VLVILDQAVVISAAHERGELAARPSIHARRDDEPRGDITVEDTPVFVPDGYRSDKPAGLLVVLHGAGGKPDQMLALVRAHAKRTNMIVIAPKSVKPSWDVVEGGLGPDVARIDRALAAVLGAYAIDPARIAIGGFSDGASYALTLGIANGELFKTIVAFAPGFQKAPRAQGTPRVFIAHGTEDTVLPIERTSRQLVRLLKGRRLDVRFHELAGGHRVSSEMLRRAFALLAP
jgi:phospholipase/carboxylesterase